MFIRLLYYIDDIFDEKVGIKFKILKTNFIRS